MDLQENGTKVATRQPRATRSTKLLDVPQVRKVIAGQLALRAQELRTTEVDLADLVDDVITELRAPA